MRFKVNSICFGSLARAIEFKQLNEQYGIDTTEIKEVA